MCGIVFINKLTPKTARILPYLCWDMANRGTDSFGFTNGEQVWRWDKSYMEVIEDFETLLWQQIDKPIVCHTRGASVGDVKLANTHPFECEHNGRRIIGVHNGGISNWEALNRQYNRNFEVDSQHIFQHLAENRPMEDIHGYGTVVWFENGQLKFVKFNSGDLTVFGVDKDIVIGCSTELPLAKATHYIKGETYKFTPLMEELVYEVNDSIEECEIMKFGTRTYVVPARYHRYYSHDIVYGNPFDVYKKGLCLVCEKKEVRTHNIVVCTDCVTSMSKQVEVAFVN